MALPLVSAIFLEAAALLGDPSKTAYTDDILLPYAKKAYGELEIELMDNGVQVPNEVSAELSVAVGETTMALLPADIVEPVYMEERDYAVTSQQYQEMIRTSWEPSIIQVERLIRWDWRENAINFVGATTRRGVRIRYRKYLSAITGSGSSVPVHLSQTYMAARTAALAAFLAGEDTERGAALAADAEKWRDKIISIATKNRQGLRARSKPYRRFLRNKRRTL